MIDDPTDPCPSCGRAVPEDALDGLCPACLFGSALEFPPEPPDEPEPTAAELPANPAGPDPAGVDPGG